MLRCKQRVQVLVVGGGINGVSTLRELALNGVDAVLVDAGDFMSGASSAPSRMIHGGLRYMENGEFALVKESLRERNRLLANAPHLVRPLPTLIPLTSHLAGIWSAMLRFFGTNVAPGERGSFIVKLGLTFYDLYAGAGRGMSRHRFFGKRDTQRRWPALRPDVVGSALYFDAKITHPERLGIEMILDSEMAGALALNHVKLGAITDGRAFLIDQLTRDEIELDVDIVVNASGAWVDQTNRLLASAPRRLIGGTKGSHIVIDNRRLKEALGQEMVYFANREGRVCIIFQHLGLVLAGSTDISVESPEGVHCEQAEVDYILASVKEVFPDIAIEPGEIVYRFSGVRPLPNSERQVNANISRDHSCEWLEPGAGASVPVLNLVGGKWTTFRAFGEEAADKVLAHLGLSRRSETSTRQIGGGHDYPDDSGREAWIARTAPDADAAYTNQLLDRYGTRARDLTARANADLQPLTSLPGYTREEIAWIVDNEHVATLADLVLRRMTIAFSGELSLAAIDDLAEIAAACLGWDEAMRKAQRHDLLDRLERFHGMPEARLQDRNPDRKEDDVRREKSTNEPPVRQRQVS